MNAPAGPSSPDETHIPMLVTGENGVRVYEVAVTPPQYRANLHRLKATQAAVGDGLGAVLFAYDPVEVQAIGKIMEAVGRVHEKFTQALTWCETARRGGSGTVQSVTK